MTNETMQQPANIVETPKATRRAVVPHYRGTENADSFEITALVPGATPGDVETVVEGDQLIVHARRSWTAPKEWTAVYREIAQTDYRLVVELDRRVNRDGVKARLVQGVLTLTLPKAEETKPRRIEIAG